jgi:glycine cleavage system H protein
MANSVPAGLLYSKEHEWVKLDGDVATVGITDYAQSSLGDIVYVELPRIGAQLTQFGSEVTGTNAGLENDPASVNRDPYGDGWFYTVKLADVSQTNELLTAEQYERVIAEA